MIHGLIFDFDGLILDTETPTFQAWQEVFARYGCELSLKTWADCIGRSQEAFNPCGYLEACLGRPIDREQVCLQEHKRETDLSERQAVLPGVRETIAAARRLGLKLGLASSSRRNWVIGHLTRLGLAEPFDCIRCADQVVHAKPEPDLYLAVLEGLGLAPQETIAFEDSPNGIMAAKRAGLLCVAVPNALTRQLPLDQADFTLSSLEGVSLAKILRMIETARVRDV